MQAEQNLQVIRTLMERAAIYRRALAPIMWWAVGVAVVSAVAGSLSCGEHFFLQWHLTGGVVVVGAFLLARRQARRDKEAFWSPPARKVAQAMLPPLAGNLVISGLFWEQSFLTAVFAGLWAIFYGCALHAAGAYAPRGLRWLGWVFVGAGGVWLVALRLAQEIPPQLGMGLVFGGLHLGYALYLTVTRRES